MSVNPTSNESLAFSIYQSNMCMRRQFNSFLSPFGISQEQYAVLSVIAKQQDLSQHQIANLINKGYPSVSRIIHILCEKYLVVKKHTQADRKTYRICLTRRGKALINSLADRISKFRRQQFSVLTAKEQKELLRLLNKVLNTST